MKRLLSILLFILTASAVEGQTSDKRYYELRIYYCLKGRLDALIARFQNYSTKLLEKHGMENVGYWVPVNNEKNTLYYILAYPDKETREKSWNDFRADPEWKAVVAKSEADGKIVESVTSVFMNGADLLPAIKGGVAAQDRLFEMRTYTCMPGKLPNLITRFKDHTLKIFENHNMENVAYFTTLEADGGQGKLLYFLAHQNEAAAKASWDAFLVDPEWVRVRDDSEKDGKIIEKLESVYMKPLAFSKIR